MIAAKTEREKLWDGGAELTVKCRECFTLNWVIFCSRWPLCVYADMHQLRCSFKMAYNGQLLSNVC